MLAIVGESAAMVRLDVFDTAEMAGSFRQVQEPGAPVGILTRLGVDPGEMQDIAPAEIESVDPGQYIAASRAFPSFEISIGDAAPVGIHEMEAAVAAVPAAKSLPLHSPSSRRLPNPVQAPRG